MTESMQMGINHLLYVIALEEYIKLSEQRGDPIEGIMETVKKAVSTRRSALQAMEEVKTLNKSQVN